MADVRARHSWVKVRIHVYICRKCGAGKVNSQDGGGAWFATFHMPTGRSARCAHVPACQVGPLTDKYLAKYSDLLSTPF